MSEFLQQQRRIRKAFSDASTRYEKAARLQREVVARLSERLEDIDIKPQCILDIGAGSGLSTRLLRKQYPRAHIVALDFAHSMLRQLQASIPFIDRLMKPPINTVCADAASLPFADNVFDLVFSSLTLQWCDAPTTVFTEAKRVLAHDGAFMCATLGPNTLAELKDSWAQADQFQHVNEFIDLHDMGDSMLRAGFNDPVVDIDRIVFSYDNVRALLLELKQLGANTVIGQRHKGLSGKRRLNEMEQAYQATQLQDGRLPATFEVIYGSAWCKQDMPLKFVAAERLYKHD